MCVESHPEGTTVRVRVTPRSSKNAVVGVRHGVLSMKVTAPPVDGEANAALLKFLAKHLGVARSALVILRGESSREKLLLVSGLSPADVRRRLSLPE